MTKNKARTRLICAFAIICFLMIILCFRAGWWQIVKADELAAEAISQQTKDTLVSAERGTIYDCNGEELAISGAAYSIWVRPGNVTKEIKKEARDAELDQTAETVAKALDMKKSEVKKYLTRDQTLVKLAKGVNKEKADSIRKLTEEEKIRGFEISEDTKRYYPLGRFASHLIGNVSDDGVGLAGVEEYYNSHLTGISGRWSRNTDVSGNRLSYGQDKYYEPEDGNSIVLTIDEVVQNNVEKAIRDTQKKTSAKRVMCMVMDVETGGILAMAVTPEYDPNDARTPLSKDKESFSQMSEKKQLNYLNKMWRNPLVSDVYEPGSTFKLLTTSIALEEGVITMKDHFHCSGSMDIAGTTIKCWRAPNAHGSQTIKEAVANSCNPALMQVGQKIGINKFYQYMDLFGITGTTGVDLPGEGTAILQDKKSAGPVGLATISFGQGIALTPIQLITAVSAIGNDGKMMKPHVMKEIRDKNGKTVETFEPQIVRQIISRKTSRQVCECMEYAVTDGGVGAAAVEGYRIGGKTGTAYKAISGGYSKNTDSSFIGLAPMEDPKVAVLVIVDSPKGEKYGSVTAAPCGQRIYKNILPYLGIQSEDKGAGKKKVKVPDIVGENYSDALGMIKGKGLEYKVKSGNEKKDFEVTDQYPKAGTEIEKGSTVYIYGDK